MKLTKQRLKEIIKEEIANICEGGINAVTMGKKKGYKLYGGWEDAEVKVRWVDPKTGKMEPGEGEWVATNKLTRVKED